MRGIGRAQQSFEQSVGVFVDGVHLGKSRQTRLGLFDLEQVEVLRGPQGILFGKNTLAGAVNVRTASPTLGGAAEGRLSVSKESYNGTITEGWFQTSLTDDLAIRFAMRETDSDGYLDNSFASEANGATATGPTTDERIWRASIKWQATDATTVDIKYLESKFERVGSTATITNFGIGGLDPLGVPASNGAMYAVMGLGFPSFGTSNSDLQRDSKTIGGVILSGGDTFKGPNERDEGTDTDNEEFSINVQHEFDNGVTMNYVFGDSYYGYEDGIDADFLPVEFIGRADDSTYNQESHELRFTGSFNDNVDWIVGANYVDSTQSIARSVVVDGTLGQPGIMSAILSGSYSANQTAAGLLYQVDPTYVNLDMSTGSPVFTVPGQASFLSLDPYAVMASITGVTIGQIVADPTLAAAWTNTGAAVPGLLSGAMGVDGGTQLLATNRMSYWQQGTQSSAAFIQGTYRIDDA